MVSIALATALPHWERPSGARTLGQLGGMTADIAFPATTIPWIAFPACAAHSLRAKTTRHAPSAISKAIMGPKGMTMLLRSTADSSCEKSLITTVCALKSQDLTMSSEEKWWNRRRIWTRTGNARPSALNNQQER